MSFLDDAMAVADGLLGGDDAASAKTRAETPPEFTRGKTLKRPGEGGAVAPQLDNTLDRSPVDFIHFGRIHGDDGGDFVHEEVNDLAGEATVEAEAVGRGVMFRAALERETLLLHGFMESTRAVLQEYADGQGPLGNVMGEAMDLLGGGGGEDEPPGAAELDLHMADASAAGGLANQEEISWLDLHTAGRDLHLHRADYLQVCADCEKHFVKKDGGGGGGGGLGGLLPEMPGVTGAMKTVQGIVFKALDIYLAMYLLLRREYEDDIEEAAYGLSLQAIEETWRPVYDIWFPQPHLPETGPEPGYEEDRNFLEEAVDEANRAAEAVTDTLNEARDEVRGFLGFEEDPPDCNGRDALETLFSTFMEQEEKVQAPSAAGTFLRAFKEVLGLDELPGFVEHLIREITGVNIGLLGRVYTAVMLGRGRVPVDEASMIRAGREELADKMMELAGRFIPGLGMLNEPGHSLLAADGIGDFGGEEISNMGSGLLDDLLGEQIGMIAELSSARLASDLEAARNAAGEKGITMEVLLGQLPRMLTLQFRNTFFPLVDLLMENVLGAVGGVAAQIASPVKGFLGDIQGAAKGVYDDAMGVYEDAMDIKQKAENVQEKLAEGVDLADAVKDPGGFVDSLTGGAGAAGPGEAAEAPPPPFPGSDRMETGKGLAVTLDAYETVKTQQDGMTIVT